MILIFLLSLGLGLGLGLNSCKFCKDADRVAHDKIIAKGNNCVSEMFTHHFHVLHVLDESNILDSPSLCVQKNP